MAASLPTPNGTTFQQVHRAKTAIIMTTIQQIIPKNTASLCERPASSLELLCGNGTSGTGRLRIWHSGSHPSWTLNQNSLSLGTTARRWSSCFFSVPSLMRCSPYHQIANYKNTTHHKQNKPTKKKKSTT